jgi:aryl-alcohol dehydrogenase-like predicted oxidoreductase
MLGKSDLKISCIGFGTMSLELNNPLNEKLLNEALEGGINYFDTADLYQQGMNESILGRAFRDIRNDVILATKVGNQWRADGSGWDWNPSKKYIISAVEKSLKRLQTSYIDVYQLHGGTINDPIDEIIEAFEQLSADGKIRFYGISSIRPNVIREYVKRSSIASVMMQYSLLDRRPEEEILSLLNENHIGVLARGSIAKGLLVSKPPEAYLDYSVEQVKQAKLAVRTISEDLHILPFETATQYVLQHEAVSSAIVGIRTPEQLKEAIIAGESIRINENQMSLLQNVLAVNTYSDHR